jgi:hypothetical protein
VQVDPNEKGRVCRDFAEPSDGLEPSTPPDYGGSQASRAYTAITRDTHFPANRAERGPNDASRDVGAKAMGRAVPALRTRSTTSSRARRRRTVLGADELVG